jgi:chromate reductase
VFLTAKDGFFDGSGAVADDRTKKFLQGWLETYLAFVKTHAKA